MVVVMNWLWRGLGRRGLVLGLIVALGGGGFWAGAEAWTRYRVYAEELLSSPPQEITIRVDMEKELDRLLNERRRALGVAPLEISNLFKNMARAQAMDMVLGNFVGHQSVRGDGFAARFEAFADGVTYQMRAENAARDRLKGPIDQVKAKRLFTQWLNSPSHNRTLQSANYLHVSTGAVAKGNHLYAVQVFWSTPMQCGGLNLCSTVTIGGHRVIKQ